MRSRAAFLASVLACCRAGRDPPDSRHVVIAAPDVPVPAPAPVSERAWPAEPVIALCEHAPDDMACVPGGSFVRGRDEDSHRCDQEGRPRMTAADTVPAARVWLQTFYIDRHEVTVTAWRACVRAGACRDVGPLYPDFQHPRQPITGVSWFDAVDFCRHAQKHLPTEAQWEKAARGPDGEPFPWGRAPVDCTRAVIQDNHGRSCGVRNAWRLHPEIGRVLDVGSRPAGVYGLFDMVGNAEEWVYDWYSEDYARCGARCLGDDPRGPCDGQSPCPGHRARAVRGGSWYWPGSHATGYHRRPHDPVNNRRGMFHHFGFRCAASVEQARSIDGRAPVVDRAEALVP